MAEGCTDCLRRQLGFDEEADYPLDTTYESGEPIYCVDGVPVVTPHKGFIGPFLASLIVDPPTMAASGTLTGSLTAVHYVNETAYTVGIMPLVTGKILFSGTDSAIDWTFTYGYTLNQTSGGSTVTDDVITDYDGIHTLTLSFPGFEIPLAPGEFATITPIMSYSSTGGGPNTAGIINANLGIMIFGGAQ